MATATVCNPIAYPAGYETGNFYCFNTTWSEQDAAIYSHCQGNGYSPSAAVQSPTPMTFVKVNRVVVMAIVRDSINYCLVLRACRVCGLIPTINNVSLLGGEERILQLPSTLSKRQSFSSG